VPVKERDEKKADNDASDDGADCKLSVSPVAVSVARLRRAEKSRGADLRREDGGQHRPPSDLSIPEGVTLNRVVLPPLRESDADDDAEVGEEDDSIEGELHGAVSCGSRSLVEMDVGALAHHDGFSTGEQFHPLVSATDDDDRDAEEEKSGHDRVDLIHVVVRAILGKNRRIRWDESTIFCRKLAFSPELFQKSGPAVHESSLPLGFAFETKRALPWWRPCGVSSSQRQPTPPQGTDQPRRGRGGVHRRACRYGRSRELPRRVRPPSTDPVQTPRSRRARSREAALRSDPLCRCRKAGRAAEARQ
jgi:hypothetical protein